MARVFPSPDWVHVPRWIFQYLQPNAAAIQGASETRWQEIREIAAQHGVPVEDLDAARSGS